MFSRIWLLLRGLVNQYIMSVEADNPEIVYDNAISQIARGELILRQKAAAVVRRANTLEEEKTATEKALKQITSQLEAAAALPPDQVDMSAAAEMVNLQEQLTEKLSGLLEDWQQAEKDEEEVRQALMDVQSERNKLKAEKDTQIGRYESAKARIDIMERQDGVSLSEVNKSLDGVRNNIKNTISEAKLSQDMKNNSLESKVRKFQQVTSGLSAQKKFEEMQAAARQKNAGAQLLNTVIENKQTGKTI